MFRQLRLQPVRRHSLDVSKPDLNPLEARLTDAGEDPVEPFSLIVTPSDRLACAFEFHVLLSFPLIVAQASPQRTENTFSSFHRRRGKAHRLGNGCAQRLPPRQAV